MTVNQSRHIDDVQRAACRALAEAATEADGIRPLSEQALLNLDSRAGEGPAEGGSTGGVRHLLAHEGDPSDPALLGYAQIDEPAAAAELVVHPEHRRRGVGTALLRSAQAAAGPGRLRVWAHGFLPPARAFADARGLRVVRELWQMTLPVAGATPPQALLPAGFVAAPFTEADLPEWIAVNARAFASHPEQGRVTADDVRDRMAQPWFDPRGFLLVRDLGAPPEGEGGANGRLAAYHWTKIDPADQPLTGEVYVVGIDPSYQGRGLARPVTDLGLAHLIGRGVHRVTLYVDGDNERAVATYRGAGFERTALDVMLAEAADVGH